MRTLLDDLFVEWLHIAPQARPLLERLQAREQRPLSGALMDHLAFRTIARPGMDRHTLAAPFLAAGWTSSGTYRFRKKKLRAESFSPPERGWPRIFISELLPDLLPPDLGEFIDHHLAQGFAEDLLTTRPTFSPIRYADYQRLAAASPYAAWVMAFGIRANHFTLDVNQLTTFDGIHALRDWMIEEGFAMNGDGLIQGSPQQYLQQASTRAPSVEVTFAGAERRHVPGCYVEVAQRHRDASTGQLFDGFLQANADKIFESTG